MQGEHADHQSGQPQDEPVRPWWRRVAHTCRNTGTQLWRDTGNFCVSLPRRVQQGCAYLGSQGQAAWDGTCEIAQGVWKGVTDTASLLYLRQSTVTQRWLARMLRRRVLSLAGEAVNVIGAVLYSAHPVGMQHAVNVTLDIIGHTVTRQQALDMVQHTRRGDGEARLGNVTIRSMVPLLQQFGSEVVRAYAGYTLVMIAFPSVGKTELAYLQVPMAVLAAAPSMLTALYLSRAHRKPFAAVWKSTISAAGRRHQAAMDGLPEGTGDTQAQLLDYQPESLLMVYGEQHDELGLVRRGALAFPRTRQVHVARVSETEGSERKSTVSDSAMVTDQSARSGGGEEGKVAWAVRFCQVAQPLAQAGHNLFFSLSYPDGSPGANQVISVAASAVLMSELSLMADGSTSRKTTRTRQALNLILFAAFVYQAVYTFRALAGDPEAVFHQGIGSGLVNLGSYGFFCAYNDGHRAALRDVFCWSDQPQASEQEETSDESPPTNRYWSFMVETCNQSCEWAWDTIVWGVTLKMFAMDKDEKDFVDAEKGRLEQITSKREGGRQGSSGP